MWPRERGTGEQLTVGRKVGAGVVLAGGVLAQPSTARADGTSLSFRRICARLALVFSCFLFLFSLMLSCVVICLVVCCLFVFSLRAAG